VIMPINSVPARAVRRSAVRRRIMVVGHPNVGKTTLFNALTGLRARTANYAGTTVEVRVARSHDAGVEIEWVDLPGFYGFEGATPDELCAIRMIEESRLALSADEELHLVMVADIRYLQRALLLAADLRDRFSALVLVLNRTDLLDSASDYPDRAVLEEALGIPVRCVSARTGEGVESLRRYLISGYKVDQRPACAERQISTPVVAPCGGCSTCPHEHHRAWARRVSENVRKRPEAANGPSRFDRVDQWLTHPWAGLAFLIVCMVAVFGALFYLAEWPMLGIETVFGGAAGWVRQTLPEGLMASFISEGIIAGVGGVVMFLPQIALLFFFLALLEDSGYLARAAVVMDSWLKPIGLPGKAIIPMVAAHACAIPAIMGTRTLTSRRDRLGTIMVLPLLSCAARIPVYVMIAALLFPGQPWHAALVLTSAYGLGVGGALVMAYLLNRTLLPGKPEPLLIELPDYQWPSLRTAMLTLYDHSLIFLRRAGTLILLVSMVLWALAAFPLASEVPDSMADESTQLEQSYLGRVGQVAEPVFAPLGFDWQITVGVLASFAAREVMVSTMAVLQGMDGESAAKDLGYQLQPVIPTATGVSLLVFFVFALQCLPTVMVVYRETGSWRWPLIQFVFMSATAYVAAWIAYQVCR
jgi:ferrous iron transport protein B